MGVFQFLVILHSESEFHCSHRPSTHPLHSLYMKVGAGSRWERALHARSGHCSIVSLSARAVTSEVFTFQEVGPLQHLYMALVDFEGRTESNGQTSQHITALH